MSKLPENPVQEGETHLQVKRHQPDYVLFCTVLLLTAIGIIEVFSGSTVWSLQRNIAPDHFALRQLGAAVLGLCALGALTYLPYRFWYKHAPKLIVVIAILLLLVLVPGIGHSSNGSSRWFGTTTIHLQPSEIAVDSISIYLAFFFTKKVTLLGNWKRSLRPAMLVVIALCALIFLEPDMGTAMTLFATALVVIFASGVQLMPIFITLGIALPLAIILAKSAAYRSSRLQAYFHPFAHPAASYQLLQSLTGISAGGLLGRGFGQSVEATGYLPYPYTDFTFATFTEQWGLIGAIALLLVFVVLIWRGFSIARQASDRFGSLLAIGFTSMIVIKAFINLGAVTWILPITGIPLPFISYGGTSLVFNLMAMGILLSISRETLDYAPAADELADVVYVDDMLQMQHERKDKYGELSLFHRRQSAPRESGRIVKPLFGQSEATSSWRNRQATSLQGESSGGKSKRREGKRPAETTRTRTSPGQGGGTKSWRERNDSFSSESKATRRRGGKSREKPERKW